MTFEITLTHHLKLCGSEGLTDIDDMIRFDCLFLYILLLPLLYSDTSIYFRQVL